MARRNKNKKKNKKIKLPDSLENLEQDSNKHIPGQVLEGHLVPVPEMSDPSIWVKLQDEFRPKESGSRDGIQSSNADQGDHPVFTYAEAPWRNLEDISLADSHGPSDECASPHWEDLNNLRPSDSMTSLNGDQISISIDGDVEASEYVDIPEPINPKVILVLGRFRYEDSP